MKRGMEGKLVSLRVASRDARAIEGVVLVLIGSTGHGGLAPLNPFGEVQTLFSL